MEFQKTDKLEKKKKLIFFGKIWLIFFTFFSPFFVEAEFQSSVDLGLLGDFYFQRRVHNAQGFIDVSMGNKGVKNEIWLGV